MADCPKCRGAMAPGFVFGPEGAIKWVDGEAGFWKSFTAAFGRKATDLTGRRCSECGFVEFFIDTQAKPVKTLRSIDEENERLRHLVIRLQDRVATLETIATDPGERTAREIEALRAVPSARDAADSQAGDR